MYKVFLGVGHGGVDTGAVSGRYREKDMTLIIALACKAELERHGVQVGISRTKDENDPLDEEIRACNAYHPTLALDIHVNAGGGDGFEAYYTHLGGTGKILAHNIQNEVIKLGQNSRGCKTRINRAGKDYYGFIRQTVCPAVIAEIGFIDNVTDRTAFDTVSKQQAFGKAYAHGILKTLGITVQQNIDDPQVQNAITVLQSKVGLEKETISYLLDYQYGDILVQKLAQAIQS